MNDFKERMNEKREEWRSSNDSRSGRVWTGIFILIIGVAGLLRASDFPMPSWLFTWPMILIVLGLFLGLRHGFRGGAWFILLIVGSIFLFEKMNPGMSMRAYIWPVALITIGLFFILRPKRRICYPGMEKKNTLSPDGTPMIDENISAEDFVDSTSIFGGAKKNIISKNFKGGDLVNIFGGTDLDLTQADFTGTSVIELTTIFGGTKLIIPSNWSIKSDAVIIFGGIEDKRKMRPTTEAPEKTLLLKGTVIFGGIDIKSY